MLILIEVPLYISINQSMPNSKPKSGAPNDNNICSEKQILPSIFYYLRTAKNFSMTVPFMYNFRNFSHKFPTIF